MSSTDVETISEPDHDSVVTVTLTPSAIMDAVFATADQVHTGWDSCVDPALVVSDMTVGDDSSGNYCRLVEQAYTEDEQPDVSWHDWAVELRLGEVYVTAHWRSEEDASPSDWEWCAIQAEEAFSRACVLLAPAGAAARPSAGSPAGAAGAQGMGSSPTKCTSLDRISSAHPSTGALSVDVSTTTQPGRR